MVMELQLQASTAPRRRCEVVPPAVDGELLRRRLVDALEGRWDAAVTTIVAGAGFGKSTALAQAIRHNHAHPRGIDAWVSCEPGDEDADRLAGAILQALEAPFIGSDPASAILGALRRTSPVPVCLVIDDSHELPVHSSAVDLLAEVLRVLPAHAHLVIAGREACPLPLARLRAADRVLDITADALAFRADEVEILAAQAGQDPDRLEPLAGWPALVRLALASPSMATRQFIWEEVVARRSGGGGDRGRRRRLQLQRLRLVDSLCPSGGAGNHHGKRRLRGGPGHRSGPVPGTGGRGVLLGTGDGTYPRIRRDRRQRLPHRWRSGGRDRRQRSAVQLQRLRPVGSGMTLTRLRVIPDCRSLVASLP